MGLDQFQIVFDNPLATFYGGQSVSGNLTLSLNSPKKIRGIVICIRGECKVHWKETRQDKNKTTVNYTAHETYFENRFHVIGGPSGDMKLKAGKHFYPFSITIPQNIPSSYEHKYGHVRYTVKGKIDRPWKFDQETKSAFTVISPLDLNTHQTAKNRVKVDADKYFGFCCWKTGPLTVGVSLPICGYVPGQQIPVTVEVDNASGQEIEAVALCLCKVVSFHAKFPYRKTKQDKLELHEVNLGSVTANMTRTFTEQITIPALPPSNLENCTFIDLDYELVVTASTVACCHRSLQLEVPLVIGTIPLTQYQLPFPHPEFSVSGGEMTNNLPSAPKLTDDIMPPPYFSAAGVNYNSLYPQLPPPSYEQAVCGGQNIQDAEDNEHVHGNMEFTPRYPVYNFHPSAPHAE